MKQVKSIYKIFTLLAVIASLLVNVSCSQEEYIYTPTNNCVTFQSVPSNGYQLDGNEIVV